jgi:hypothetical protein
MHSSTIVAIGTEASVGVFTSSLGHRDLYHHMILPINIPTVMQMLTRFATFKLQFYCPRNFLATQCLIKKKKKRRIMLINYIFRLFLNVLQWVSHRNHRGNICGVDFIWLCNPSKSLKPLRTSWAEAVFGITKVSNDSFDSTCNCNCICLAIMVLELFQSKPKISLVYSLCFEKLHWLKMMHLPF